MVLHRIVKIDLCLCTSTLYTLWVGISCLSLYTCTCIHNRYLPVIGVHEMHGRMHPNYWQITILLVVDLCSSLAYFMMTQPLPIAGKLPIKTLVAKQLPTNVHTYNIISYCVLNTPLKGCTMHTYNIVISYCVLNTPLKGCTMHTYNIIISYCVLNTLLKGCTNEKQLLTLVHRTPKEHC